MAAALTKTEAANAEAAAERGRDRRDEEIENMRNIDNALRNLFAQVDSFLIILSLKLIEFTSNRWRTLAFDYRRGKTAEQARARADRAAD